MKIATRNHFTTNFVREVVSYSGTDYYGVEIAIPPVFTYDQKEYTLEAPQKILTSYKFNPFKDTGKSYHIFRKSFYESLSRFPKLNLDNLGKKHTLAEFLYSSIVYFRPTSTFESYLSKLPFSQRGEELSSTLITLADKIKKDYSLSLDLWAVPKREVGSLIHISDENGYSRISKLISFGYHKTFPQDRITRESGSLKESYRYNNPNHLGYKFNEIIAPYVTMLKVAVIFPRENMADGGEFFSSAIPHLSTSFTRDREVDLYSKEYPESIIDINVSSTSISLKRVLRTIINENQYLMGPLRLVLPGGVKVCASFNNNQAIDKNNQPIDLLLDYRTFVSKGAVGTLMMLQKGLGICPTAEEALEYFNSGLKMTTIKIGAETLNALVGHLPIFRPSQSYLTLNKPGVVGLDIISRIVTDSSLYPHKETERDYQELSRLYSQIRTHELIN